MGLIECKGITKRFGEKVALDDVSVDTVRSRLLAPLKIVENTGEAFWRAISGLDDDTDAVK